MTLDCELQGDCLYAAQTATIRSISWVGRLLLLKGRWTASQ